MKLKTVEVNGKTYAEVQDGRPVYVHEDGKDVAVDAPANIATISRISGEVRSYRERAEKAEIDLKKFEGIEDPEVARKAIETVANLETGKLLTAGKVEEIKAAAKKTAEEQVAAAIKSANDKYGIIEKERDTAVSKVYSLMIGGGFSNSRFIADKSAIPADLMQARFGSAFKVEDGKIVAYDQSGNKIYSRVKNGDLAEFDEALEMLVDAYPYRDQILKGANHSGSGARPGANGANGSKRSISRADFDRLAPAEQRAAAIGKDAMTIVD